MHAFSQIFFYLFFFVFFCQWDMTIPAADCSHFIGIISFLFPSSDSRPCPSWPSQSHSCCTYPSPSSCPCSCLIYSCPGVSIISSIALCSSFWCWRLCYATFHLFSFICSQPGSDSALYVIFFFSTGSGQVVLFIVHGFSRFAVCWPSSGTSSS